MTLLTARSVRADESDTCVLSTDAIALAGRSDIVIPPIGGNLGAFPLIRTEPGPGQALETFPRSIPVTPGELLGFDAVGLQPRYSPGALPSGPDGDFPKDVEPVGGISGYKGPGGSLVGVFLDDDIPVSGPPASLDFSDEGLGTSFPSLAPEPGQIFFIGDGLTGTQNGARQRFEVPAKVSRLLFGTLDSLGLGGPPGFYTDNNGCIRVQLIPEDIEVFATDAISLAGRTDVVIPPIGGNLGAFPLIRTEPGPGQALETFPISLPATGGERLYFYAFGFARFSPSAAETGPEGDVPKFVTPVGGISGYKGPGGSLVGVFLDDEIPVSDPPASLDFSFPPDEFSEEPLGTDFSSLAPALGQIFFIGDGMSNNANRVGQEFLAPAGSTRVLLGTMDSYGPSETPPGFYTDNSGSFYVNLVPEPAPGLLALASLASLAARRGWRSVSRAQTAAAATRGK